MIYLLLYILLSVLSLTYTVKDPLPKSIQNIVILSSSFKNITRQRIKTGLKLASFYPESKILFSGHDHIELFLKHSKNIKSRVLIEDKSTNTYENAFFCKKFLGDSKNIILVTSHSHQVRARNTFRRVYEDLEICNYPTNDIFTLYSPLLPSGWIASLINFIKDWKYNRE